MDDPHEDPPIDVRSGPDQNPHLHCTDRPVPVKIQLGEEGRRSHPQNFVARFGVSRDILHSLNHHSGNVVVCRRVVEQPVAMRVVDEGTGKHSWD